MNRLPIRFETAVSDVLARHGAPGAQVALRLDGELAVDAAFGYRDRARSEPLAATDRFYLYSVTKSLLAGAVLKLAEDGVLGLEDSLAAWLPDIPGLDPAVTVAQVLAHTGGLPDYGPLPEYHEAVRAHPGRPWTDADYLARTLGARGALFAPGGGWAYSNVGYMLVRRLLCAATGEDLDAVLARTYFVPLGLAGTVVAHEPGQGIVPGWSDALRADEARPGAGSLRADEARPGARSLRADHALEDVSSRYHPGWVAHSLVISTARDATAIVDALATGAIVSPRSLERMRTPSPPRFPAPPFRDAAYGLGLMLGDTDRYGRAFGHNGEGPGFSAAAWVFESAGGPRAAVAALVNRDGHNVAQDVVFAVLDSFRAGR